MRNTILTAALVILVGCGTLGNPFGMMKPDYSALPEAAMRDVAREIETAVAKGDRTPTIADRDGVVVNNEAVMQAIRTRAARQTLVSSFLDSGFAWERADGLISILRTKEYKHAGTARDRDRNAVLVLGENQSRWEIYEGILKASKLSPKALGAIQDIFYKARLECLQKGQKYEDPSGKAAVKSD